MIEPEKALDFLKATDEQDAQLKANLEYLKEKKKTVIALECAESDATSQAAKEQDAYASESYKAWLSEFKGGTYDYLALHNRRLSASLQIEIWRSLNANQRTGNI